MKMKKTFKFLALTMLLSISGTLATFAQVQLKGAEFFEENGMKYTVLTIDKAQMTGTVAVSVNAMDPVPETLDIPSSYEKTVQGNYINEGVTGKVTFTVVAVEAYGFGLNTSPVPAVGKQMIGLKTLNIPASIEYIGSYAFNNAGDLATVNFAAGSKLKSLGDCAFDNTNIQTLDLTNCTSLKTLGKGSVWVYDWLNGTWKQEEVYSTPFTSRDGDSVNRQLKEVKLPAGIEDIGIAFANCEVLEKLDLSNTKVYELCDYALENTFALKGNADGVFVIPASPNIETSCKIGDYAFLNSGIEKLDIKTQIKGIKPIAANAFKQMPKLAELTFDGNLLSEAIPTNAFTWTGDDNKAKQSPLKKITFNGKLGNATILPELISHPIIADQAVKGIDALEEVTFNGDIETERAVGFEAFANCKKLKSLNLLGNLDASGAILPKAFANSGTDVNMTVTIGTSAGNGITAPTPIASTAFDGACVSTINIYELKAPWAINESQFENVSYKGYKYEEGKALTVNFLSDISTANVLGPKAFSTGYLGTVNLKSLLTASAFKASMTQEDDVNPLFGNSIPVEGIDNLRDFVVVGRPVSEWVLRSPFYNAGPAEGGKGFTLNLNGDTYVTRGFGDFAFADANVKTINMNPAAAYQAAALAETSFFWINDKQGTPNVWVNYLPASATSTLAIAQNAFMFPTEIVDIYFKTTPAVKETYVNSTFGYDKTPWRMKFIMSLGIETFKASNGQAYGIFAPQDEPYVIDKYSDDNKDLKVKVYSAYLDDKSLTGAYVDPEGAKADLYLNPLRVQDNGKYVINRGHAVLVVTSNPGTVIAEQNVAPMYPPYEDGGIQTFAGLNVWQANDLRYNASVQIYESANDNGYTDLYGNKLYDYEIFRLKQPKADFNYSWPNTKMIYPNSLYVMVGKREFDQWGNETFAQMLRRKAYSTNGDPNGAFNQGKSWKEMYAELVEILNGIEDDPQDNGFLGLLQALNEADKALNGYNEEDEVTGELEHVNGAKDDLADAKDAYKAADEKLYGEYQTYIDDEGNEVPIFVNNEAVEDDPETEDVNESEPASFKDIARKDGGLQGEYDEKKADLDEMLGTATEYYTAEEADEANAELDGALAGGTVLDAEQAADVNAALDLSGDDMLVDGDELPDELAAEYNATLDGAVKEGDPKDPGTGITALQENIAAKKQASDDALAEYEQAQQEYQDAYNANLAARNALYRKAGVSGGTADNPAPGSVADQYNKAKAELDYWTSLSSLDETELETNWDDEIAGETYDSWKGTDDYAQQMLRINNEISSAQVALYGADGTEDDPDDESLAATYNELKQDYDTKKQARKDKDANQKAKADAHSAAHLEYNDALVALYGESTTEEEPSDSHYTDGSVYGQYVALNEELYGIKENNANPGSNEFPGSEENYAEYDETLVDEEAGTDGNCLYAQLQHAIEVYNDAKDDLDQAKADLAEAQADYDAAVAAINDEMDAADQISGARLNIIWNDRDGVEDVTAIMEAVVAKNGSKNLKGIYNLQGIKVNNPAAKGVYIQDGKKVVK